MLSGRSVLTIKHIDMSIEKGMRPCRRPGFTLWRLHREPGGRNPEALRILKEVRFIAAEDTRGRKSF